MKTIKKCIRFRDDELETASRLADQCGCTSSDIVRIGLLRLIQSPPTESEVEFTRLKIGVAAMSPELRRKAREKGAKTQTRNAKRNNSSDS